MKLLSFDTSTPNFSLALSLNSSVKEESFNLGNELSDQIIPRIKSLLRGNNVALQDMDGIVIGIGPGSFTGLRIGLAAAKAFAFALNKPLVGVSSLDGLAVNALPYAKKICCIADAKREKIYAAVYKNENGFLRRKTPYLLTDIKELLKRISGEVWFIGDGLSLYQGQIKKRLGKRANFASSDHWFPRAGNLAKLALPRFVSKKSDDLHKLLPIYLYPPECQVRLKK